MHWECIRSGDSAGGSKLIEQTLPWVFQFTLVQSVIYLLLTPPVPTCVI